MSRCRGDVAAEVGGERDVAAEVGGERDVAPSRFGRGDVAPSRFRGETRIGGVANFATSVRARPGDTSVLWSDHVENARPSARV